MEQPPIPRATSVLVLNDMINGNLRGANERHNQLIAESGLIASTARCVAALRQRDVPIVWVRVERRADRKDVVDTLTDAFLAGGRQPRPAVTRGMTGSRRSTSTAMPTNVFATESASAPAFSQARATAPMSVTFGESFAQSGMSVTRRTAATTSSAIAGSAQKSAPPRSRLGQEMFSSSATTFPPRARP